MALEAAAVEAVAVEQYFIARIQWITASWKGGISYAEQQSLLTPERRLARLGNVQGIRMPRPREAKNAVAMVVQRVHHGDEWLFGEMLLEEIFVKPPEHFFGRHQAIIAAKHFLGLDPLFDENGQQTGGNAVAHNIGDVQADMIFVEAKHVIEVAANAIARQKVDGEATVRHFRQILRQETRLDALSQLQLIIDLLMKLLQTFIETAQLGALSGQVIVSVLLPHVTAPSLSPYARNNLHPIGSILFAFAAVPVAPAARFRWPDETSAGR